MMTMTDMTPAYAHVRPVITMTEIYNDVSIYAWMLGVHSVLINHTPNLPADILLVVQRTQG
eukprot:m.738362 g.738362  ORF g.738362 m.738362 type:complete len:61 (+) comp23099_c0_seq10:1822-2004(+)